MSITDNLPTDPEAAKQVLELRKTLARIAQGLGALVGEINTAADELHKPE